jgi:outer membrane protein TolC
MKRLLRATLCAAVFALSGPGARAQDIPTPSFLPSTAQAQAWIEADPAVAKARHAAAAGNHGGAAIAAGSHEWTARLQGQQRRYQDSGARSREWLAQLERGIRVNGKAGLDRELQDVEAKLGTFRVGEARHESARALSDLWTGVIATERQRVLLQEQLAFARSNLDAVEKRKRAGEASALDVNVAQADIGEVQREASLAATEAAKLRAALRVRYAAEVPAGALLPEPQEPIWPEPKWRDRVIEEADPLKTAEAEGQRSRLQAARVRADRVPDPTVGVMADSFGYDHAASVRRRQAAPHESLFQTHQQPESAAKSQGVAHPLPLLDRVRTQSRRVGDHSG